MNKVGLPTTIMDKAMEAINRIKKQKPKSNLVFVMEGDICKIKDVLSWTTQEIIINELA